MKQLTNITQKITQKISQLLRQSPQKTKPIGFREPTTELEFRGLQQR